MAMKRTIDFHLNDQRKKANLYRAIKNDLDDDSSTDEEPMNRSDNLHPLSYYANDPEQLIHQLFSVVRGKRLARLIPPELKNMSFEELKADCLIQLLCMSKKRVLATLEGREMNSSSDSDDSVDNQKKQTLEAEQNSEGLCKRSHKEKKLKPSKKKKVETESDPEKEEEKDGKTLLEILELEMKAKAIRALLGPNQQDTNTQIEEAIKNELVEEKTDVKINEDKSWSERYEEREDVKEVVKTSKLCTNMRRRMLLHQQKMLADRAKAKAEEAEKIKSGDTIKSKLQGRLQNMYSAIADEQSTINAAMKISSNSCEKSLGDSESVEQTNDKLQTTNKIQGDGGVTMKINNSDIISNEQTITSNTQESTTTDDDSQKSTDFERVLSEYTQKNTDLETTINEYSQKNTDLEKEINTCSKKNDDMENTMNRCAQKNSDIESVINNYSVENNGIDEAIAKSDQKNSDLDTAIGEYSKNSTDLNSLIGSYTQKNVDLKAIVKEYSKRNSDIMTLMGEYSQNNIDIQSVIGDYAEGNHKLETIIDEYSHRNAKIKTMINEYSVNNSNVEKIIDRNNRKQSLIDKCKVESATEKAAETFVCRDLKAAGNEEKIRTTDIVVCESKNSNNLDTNINVSN